MDMQPPFEENAFTPPEFVHTQLHPDDSAYSDWKDHDEHAVIYNPKSNKIFVGKPGIHHEDLLREFNGKGLSFSDEVAMGDVTPGGNFINHYGFGLHPGVEDHIRSYFDAHKRADDDEWGWKFGAAKWTILEGETLPEDSQHKDVTDGNPSTFGQRRPYLYDSYNKEVYVGQPGTHHDDVGQEFGLPVQGNWGEVQPSGEHYGPHGKANMKSQINKHLGLPPIGGADSKWKFGMTLTHHNWTPGNHGKGFLTADGTPVTWNLDDDWEYNQKEAAGPHHAEVAEEMGLSEDPINNRDGEGGNWHTPIYINPDGVYNKLNYWPEALHEDDGQFEKAGLKQAGPGWHFGKVGYADDPDNKLTGPIRRNTKLPYGFDNWYEGPGKVSLMNNGDLYAWSTPDGIMTRDTHHGDFYEALAHERGVNPEEVHKEFIGDGWINDENKPLTWFGHQVKSNGEDHEKLVADALGLASLGKQWAFGKTAKDNIWPWHLGIAGKAMVYGSIDHPAVFSWAAPNGSPHHWEVGAKEGIFNYLACEISPDGEVRVLFGDPSAADAVVKKVPGTHKGKDNAWSFGSKQAGAFDWEKEFHGMHKPEDYEPWKRGSEGKWVAQNGKAHIVVDHGWHSENDENKHIHSVIADAHGIHGDFDAGWISPDGSWHGNVTDPTNELPVSDKIIRAGGKGVYDDPFNAWQPKQAGVDGRKKIPGQSLLMWNPDEGTDGRILLMRDGTIVAWNNDEDWHPYHQEMIMDLGLSSHDIDGYMYIAKTGRVSGGSVAMNAAAQKILGPAKELPAKEWHFGAEEPGFWYEDLGGKYKHAPPWQTGRSGKAIEMPNGKVIHWSVDRHDAPHHQDALEANGGTVEDFYGNNAANCYYLEPSGRIVSYQGKGGDYRHIAEQIPGSTHAGEQWHFGSAQAIVPKGEDAWQPGHRGKGLFGPNGEMYLWSTSVDWAAHHPDVMKAVDPSYTRPGGYSGYSLSDKPDRTFTVDPEGIVRSAIWNKENQLPMDKILAGDSRLKAPPATEPAWHFGAEVPNVPDWDGSEEEDWEPGHYGKGLVTKANGFQAWKVDNHGNPGHGNVDCDPDWPSLNGDHWGHAFHINPKGEVNFWCEAHPEAMEEARQAPGVTDVKDAGAGHWHFNKVAAFDYEPWERGNYGKCLLTKQGDVHHWTTEHKADGRPYHSDYQGDNSVHRNNVATAGWISPDGTVKALHDEHLPALREAIPGAKSPKTDWHFGAEQWPEPPDPKQNWQSIKTRDNKWHFWQGDAHAVHMLKNQIEPHQVETYASYAEPHGWGAPGWHDHTSMRDSYEAIHKGLVDDAKAGDSMWFAHIGSTARHREWING